MNKTDEFANYAIIKVTESAANTLTFQKLETGISINDKVAWLLNRVEYFPPAFSNAIFNGDGDGFDFGLSVSNSWSTVSAQEVTIIDLNTIARRDFGAAAVTIREESPVLKDFSNLPGGGVLVPPVPFYLWAKGSGLASAGALVARIHYTLIQLATDQYWQLVEARRVLSS